MVKIGIPRALFYYYYYPLWRAFFNSMGLEVVLSPETNKAILDNGIETTLSEACLPVKVFFGHVTAIADQVDYLFVPRITRVEPKAYICPKFMGLPDMLRARLNNLPVLVDTVVDAGINGDSIQCWEDCFREVGSIFTRDKQLVDSSIKEALQAGFLAWVHRCFRSFPKGCHLFGVALSGLLRTDSPSQWRDRTFSPRTFQC
jgi:predicted nucleotide-binding protein (sugar kinase/HSP70/actin superfamily)